MLQIETYTVENEDYSSTVLVKINNGDKYCNGFHHMIGHIIVSASCIGDAAADSVVVLAGSWDKTLAAEFVVDAVIVHPKYNSATMENNIAKLVMKRTLAPIPGLGYNHHVNITDASHCEYVGFTSTGNLLIREGVKIGQCVTGDTNQIACFGMPSIGACDFYASGILTCYTTSSADHSPVAIGSVVDCKEGSVGTKLCNYESFIWQLSACNGHQNRISTLAITMSLLFAVKGLLIYYGYCIVVKWRSFIRKIII